MRAETKPGGRADRTPKGGVTRAAILAAAESVFARTGLEGARTEAIASAAGVNKAMLYYYFRSKDLLYAAVLENHMKEFHRRAMEVLAASGSPGAAVLRFVETHFDYISGHPDYPRLFQYMLMTDAGRGGRMIRKYLAPVSRRLIEVMDLGQRRREMRRFDSHQASISLVALNVFYFAASPVMRIVTGMDPYSARSLKHRREEVLAFVRHGLFRKPGAVRVSC